MSGLTSEVWRLTSEKGGRSRRCKDRGSGVSGPSRGRGCSVAEEGRRVEKTTQTLFVCLCGPSWRGGTEGRGRPRRAREEGTGSRLPPLEVAGRKWSIFYDVPLPTQRVLSGPGVGERTSGRVKTRQGTRRSWPPTSNPYRSFPT